MAEGSGTQSSGLLDLLKSLYAGVVSPMSAPSLTDSQKAQAAAALAHGANAFMLNQSPRVAGGYEALLSAFTPETMGDAYTRGAQEQQAGLESIQQEFPGSSAAGTVVGAVASPVNKVYGAVSKIPSVAGRLATALGIGATEGGVLASGDPNATGEDLLRGAITGAAFGSAGQGVEEVGKGLAKSYEPLYRAATGITAPDTKQFLKESSNQQFRDKAPTIIEEGLDLLRQEGKLPKTLTTIGPYQKQLAESAEEILSRKAQESFKLLEPVDEIIKQGATPTSMLKLQEGGRVARRMDQLTPDLQKQVRREAQELINQVMADKGKGSYWGLKEWAKRKSKFDYSVDPKSAEGYVVASINDTIDDALNRYSESKDAYRRFLDDESKLMAIKEATSRKGANRKSAWEDINKMFFTTGSTGAVGAAGLGMAYGLPTALAAGAVPAALIGLSLPMGKRALAEGFNAASPLLTGPVPQAIRGAGRTANMITERGEPQAAGIQEVRAGPGPMETVFGKNRQQTPKAPSAVMQRVFGIGAVPKVAIEGDLAPLMERFGDLRLAAAAQLSGVDTVQKALAQAGSSEWSKVSKYLPQNTIQAATAIGLEAGLSN